MGNVKLGSSPQRPVLLPLIIALGNHIIKEISLVEKITESVRWDPSQHVDRIHDQKGILSIQGRFRSPSTNRIQFLVKCEDG